MKVTGIVAEYNPFHNGHKYHLEKAKKITAADYLIVVMSGNYVQRGEPAILDKWTRTKMALENGADIVIELPSIYSSSSAEFFAQGSVALLNSTNLISSLCFGAETNNIEVMKSFANILYNEPSEYKIILKQELAKGLVFPAARANALKIFTGNDSTFLDSPNNILAVEYLKAIMKLKSDIIPYIVKRNIADYHSLDMTSNIASATAIRNALKNKNSEFINNVIPKNSIKTFSDAISKGVAPVFFDELSMLLHYKLRISSPEQLADILDITEGLENRIINIAKNNFTISDIVSNVKTKRYTYTKIQRALLHIILDFKKSDLCEYNNHTEGAIYIRVLGFRKVSENLLSILCNSASIPVITNIKKAQETLSPIGMKMLKQELSSTDIYFLANPSIKQRLANKEYTMPIVLF